MGPTGFGCGSPSSFWTDGERVAVVGPSGSGKTTLLNLIAGILTPEAGRIDVAGTEVSGLSDAERRRFRASRIGFVFQDFALLDYLSARQNIHYPYRITPALVLDDAVRTEPSGWRPPAGSATNSIGIRRRFLRANNSGWRSAGHWSRSRS